jgi:7-cyano-7-deazaguanine synthase
MPKDLAITLCNGSLNSVVAATLAAQKHRIIVLTADGGAAPGSRRHAACDLFISSLKPFREHVVALPFQSSQQYASGADPRANADLAPRLIDLTPLLGIAIRFAAQHSAGSIHTGLRVGPEGPALTRATEFLQIFSELAQLPLGLPELEFNFPLLELEPWQVVDLGIQIGAPLDKTWSCHQDGPDPCHACAGCRARDAAFEQAAKPDPLSKR